MSKDILGSSAILRTIEDEEQKTSLESLQTVVLFTV